MYRAYNIHNLMLKILAVNVVSVQKHNWMLETQGYAYSYRYVNDMPL